MIRPLPETRFEGNLLALLLLNLVVLERYLSFTDAALVVISCPSCTPCHSVALELTFCGVQLVRFPEMRVRAEYSRNIKKADIC